MNWFAKIAVLILITSLVLNSCKKQVCDDPVPFIEFKEFIQKTDKSAKLVLNFRDCNGDIGLTQADTVEPYKFNLYMEYYELQNGTWVNLVPLIPYYYRIPVLLKDGREDNTEGEIEVTIPTYYRPNTPSYSFDTIKFEVKILDQALNESNIVETNLIIKPSN